MKENIGELYFHLSILWNMETESNKISIHLKTFLCEVLTCELALNVLCINIMH